MSWTSTMITLASVLKFYSITDFMYNLFIKSKFRSNSILEINLRG